MASEKARYWIAVSVLALIVGNNFAARHGADVRCLASRSLAAIEQVSGHANGLAAMAETMLGRGETRFVQTQTMFADVQTRVASAQSVFARHQAAFARLQVEHARIAAVQDLGRTVVCPRQNLRMVVLQPFRDGTI